MPTPPHRLYSKLDSWEAIENLVGQPEDLVLECKKWPGFSDKIRGALAKAACGFANAVGGVIVVGLDARRAAKDEPDVIQEVLDFPEFARVLNFCVETIDQLVEPAVPGVEAKHILRPGQETGVVIILVPAADGSVRRSRQSKDFYQRLSTGTAPMEYYQIEDRFGRRPTPKLRALLVASALVPRVTMHQEPCRHIDLYLRNEGRGIARFPGINLARSKNIFIDQLGIDGSGRTGLPLSAIVDHSWLFRGGADLVIYPEEEFHAHRFIQRAEKKEETIPMAVDLGFHRVKRTSICQQLTLGIVLYAEGMQRTQSTVAIDEEIMVDVVKVDHSTNFSARNPRASW